MSDILHTIAEYTRERIAAEKKRIPLSEMRAQAEAMERENFPLERALQGKELSFICECKKASPSKGLIAPDFPYVEIAKEYEEAGASAISVLTEPKWFLGSDEYLRAISQAVRTPCLKKDFTVDEYMIYQAKVYGAKAVLLICSITEKSALADYLALCDALGLSALVEAHSAQEVETALGAGARVIGVNNRNLKDFTIDTENSRKLRSLVPQEVIFVSESGVRNESDVAQLKAIGVNAVLIGETLMRSADKKETLARFRRA